MAQTADEMVKAIESKTGVARPWRKILAELDPEFMDIQTQAYSYVFEKRKSLPRKFKEILELCLDAVTGCEAGFRIHARGALNAGANVEEILEALEVTSAFNWHYLTEFLPALMDEKEKFDQQTKK